MYSIFNKKLVYKPFWYKWAYDAFVASEQMHWLVREISFNEDIKDWKCVLTKQECEILTQIFRFFTQADIDVASCYIDHYLPAIKPIELRMMLGSIVAREAIHVQAYATIIDELGISESEYASFLEYKEMADKHEYIFSNMQPLTDDLIAKLSETDIAAYDLLRKIVKFSVFGEGMQLFASFIILLNFTRFGKMKGMGQVVSWSIRDETHHVDSMLKLYHTILAEHPILTTQPYYDILVGEIYDICHAMTLLEKRFVDLAYKMGGADGLTAFEVKKYIEHIADVRLTQLDLTPVFGIKKNPLPWVDLIVFGKEHTNFFENTATDYAKASVVGNWEDAFS